MRTMSLKNQVCAYALLMVLPFSIGFSVEIQDENLTSDLVETIQMNRDNPDVLAELLPIVGCSFNPSKYELILMNQLRNKNTTTAEFRDIARKVGELLVNKVVECLPTHKVMEESPVIRYEGDVLGCGIELVSIMRSGDAMIETFLGHFPKAHVSKILIQRDEETAEPCFTYMKLSPTIASSHYVVIPEPMIATGGSLNMAISLLKEKGVREDHIIVACVCAAPEGLAFLNQNFPAIKVVMTVLDERLNERKYIMPGLGDFGDRYFGTVR